MHLGVSIPNLFLIKQFRHVLNVVPFLSGDSREPEFYVPTFRNTVCSISICGVRRKNNWEEISRVFKQINLFLVILPAYATYEAGTDKSVSKRPAHKIQTPGNLPKERIRHTELSYHCNLEIGICVPLRLQLLIEANFASCTYLQLLMLTLHISVFHVLL